MVVGLNYDTVNVIHTRMTDSNEYMLHLGFALHESTLIYNTISSKKWICPIDNIHECQCSASNIKYNPNRAAQSGGTTVGSGIQYNVPGSIQPLVSVNSFDMTIYDTHGKVLWNKVDQPVTGGKGLEQVVFPNGYSGNITILIHNIKPGLDKGQKAPDTVEFSAKVG